MVCYTTLYIQAVRDTYSSSRGGSRNDSMLFLQAEQNRVGEQGFSESDWREGGREGGRCKHYRSLEREGELGMFRPK